MARHAKLTQALAAQQEDWSWHTLKAGSVSSEQFLRGERRLDAESYLSGGFAIRHAIERNPSGWKRFGDMADAWVPPRLKAILVEREFGVPYLNTSQVFDIRPASRKWLSLEKTPHSERRFAKQGGILVMASANVGRSLVTYKAHEGCLLSHHFMRVEAFEPSQRGWIYAFLRSPQGLAMMSGSQYASVIRHIEPPHLKALPIPLVDEATAKGFEQRVERLLELRNQTYTLTLEAERLFEQAFGPLGTEQAETGFVGTLSQLRQGRRRLEASYHAPRVTAILRRIAQLGSNTTVGKVSKRVWWMSRFKRVYGDGGIPYVSADELFSINPTDVKRILVDPMDGHHDYMVQAGWIAMACSGQVYGLNGSALLLTKEHEQQFFSHDLIRIIPDTGKIRAGFLLTALTHPTLGRPLVIRAAYGTSIPHLDPADVSAVPVVRFDAAFEGAIADCAESSAAARAEADALERELSEDAGRLIDRFIASGSLTGMGSVRSHASSPLRPTPSLVEHARVRLRAAMAKHQLRAGATGTIVHIYGDGAGYEVEFDASSASPKVVTLEHDAIEPLTD